MCAVVFTLSPSGKGRRTASGTVTGLGATFGPKPQLMLKATGLPNFRNG